MSDDTKVVMNIPQDVIQAQVQAAIAGVLQQRGNDLIDELIKTVLNEPVRDSYGNEVTRRDSKGRTSRVTRWQVAFEASIHKAVKEELDAWTVENREEIKKAVRAYLGRTKKELVAKIADKIVNELSTPHVSVHMKFGDD